MLYRFADEFGATKIALGHHADDFVETLLLNLMFAGQLKAMPARLLSDDGLHTVIRPLVYASESDARAYAKQNDLPIIGCCCSACGDFSLQRQRVKRLIADLEHEHPGVRASMLEGARQRGAAAPARHTPEPGGGNRAGPGGCEGMRAVVQRTTSARVMVDGVTVGEIGLGLLVLIGVGREDGPADVQYIASKVRELRVFPDDEGKMNRSLVEAGGSILAVSQFTLYGDCRKGRRPSFIDAAAPEVGRLLFDEVVRVLRESGVTVATGTFQTHMLVELVNDGPVTILIDSRKEF